MSTLRFRTIFIGTPDFGAPALEALLAAPEFELVGVITQPDKPVGRKQILTASPIKQIAIKNNLPVWQPARIANYELRIANLDLIIVIAYAQIIPKKILDMPKYGCINVHGSLLPKYRGASCIQAAIKNGDEKTGISIMKMDEGLDTGPIISQFDLPITPDDTAGTVYEKLSSLAGQKIRTSLLDYIAGKAIPQEQDNAQASYVGLTKKTDGKIDWGKSAEKIERLVRAMQTWPKAYSILPGSKKIIIHSVEKKSIASNENPGTIFIANGQLAIKAQDKALIIKELQLEGKNKTKADEFIKGYSKYLGKILK